MSEKQTLHVESDPLGMGFGNTCRRIEGTEDVVMTEHLGGRLFQTNTADFVRKCLESLDRHGVSVAEGIEVLEDIRVLGDGINRQVTCAVKEPFIEDFDDRVLEFTIGRELLDEIMEIVRVGYDIRVEDELGLDPMGAGLVWDVFKGAPKAVIFFLAKFLPQAAKKSLLNGVGGVKGKARNLIYNDEGELQYTDILMHDLSKDGKLLWLMRQYNSFTFAGLVEMAGYINRNLPEEERVEKSELDELPMIANRLHKALAKGLFKMMLPLFEHHRKISEINKGHPVKCT